MLISDTFQRSCVKVPLVAGTSSESQVETVDLEGHLVQVEFETVQEIFEDEEDDEEEVSRRLTDLSLISGSIRCFFHPDLSGISIFSFLKFCNLNVFSINPVLVPVLMILINLKIIRLPVLNSFAHFPSFFFFRRKTTERYRYFFVVNRFPDQL